MLATRNASKRSKHEKRPIEELKEPSSKWKSKATKEKMTEDAVVSKREMEEWPAAEMSDDDDDSSDEEDDEEDDNIPELGTLKLHYVLKDDATVKRKLEQAKCQPVMSFYFHVWATC